MPSSRLLAPITPGVVDEEDVVDLAEVSEKLVALEKEMGETDKVIAGFCGELGIKVPF